MRIFLSFYFLIIALLGLSQSIDEHIAVQFYENNEFEKAESLFKKLYRKGSRSAFVYEPYLNSLIALDKEKEAERLTESHIRKFPTNIGLLVDLGMVYDRFGKKEKAENYFDKIIKSSQSNVFEIKMLANGFKRRGYFEKAIAAYETGVKKHGTIELYVDLIYTYRSMLKVRELADFSLRLLEENPSTYRFVIKNLDIVFEDSANASHLQLQAMSFVQKKPDNIVFGELLLECLIHQKKYPAALKQVCSLDRLRNDQGNRVMRFARLCVDVKVFAVAVDAYSYVVGLGKTNKNYIGGQNGLINSLYLQTTAGINPDKEKINNLAVKIKQFIEYEGLGYETAESVIRLAELSLFYSNKAGVAIELLLKLIETPQLKNTLIAKTKLLLGDCYLMSDNLWDARLMYGQVEKQFKEDALGQEARFKNAQLSYYTGDFDWAKNQLDVLKTATTQLISNNAIELSLLIQDNTGLDSTDEAMKEYAAAQFLLYQNKILKCKEMLNLLPFKYPNHSLSDEILYLKAQVQEKLGSYEEANRLYQSVYENFSGDILADNALYRSAMINLQVLKNKEMAVQLFEKIILEHNSSLYVSRARDFYYQLKKGA
jgi:predicted Zn-dependent protease